MYELQIACIAYLAVAFLFIGRCILWVACFLSMGYENGFYIKKEFTSKFYIYETCYHVCENHHFMSKSVYPTVLNVFEFFWTFSQISVNL